MEAQRVRFRPGCCALILVFAATQLWVRPAAGAMITTETVIAARTAEQARHRVRAFVAREDVRAWMQRLGVDPEEAQARVAALSDEEVARVNARLDDLPAGGSFLEVIAAILLVILLILVITDLVGYTDVFPFIRPLPSPPNR